MFKKAGSIVLAGGLLAVIGLGQAAGAPKEPQKLSNAQLRQAIHTLQAIKITLEKADHDYGGHRVAAVKDIKAAQHQLRLALGAVSKKKPPVKGKGKTNPTPEPQALSDAQLAEAVGFLNQTIQLLKMADHDYGGHRAAAVRDLGRAVHQLNLALKFRKGKGVG